MDISAAIAVYPMLKLLHHDVQEMAPHGPNVFCRVCRPPVVVVLHLRDSNVENLGGLVFFRMLLCLV